MKPKWTLIFVGCLMGTFLFGQTTNSNLNPRQQAMAAASHTPINFWGKVVDENGMPVEGAAATFAVSKMLFDEDKLKKVVLTDANGLFSLTGETGFWMSVSVAKDGYKPNTPEETSISLDYFLEAKKDRKSFPRGGVREPFPTAKLPTVFILTK